MAEGQQDSQYFVEIVGLTTYIRNGILAIFQDPQYRLNAYSPIKVRRIKPGESPLADAAHPHGLSLWSVTSNDQVLATQFPLFMIVSLPITGAKEIIQTALYQRRILLGELRKQEDAMAAAAQGEAEDLDDFDSEEYDQEFDGEEEDLETEGEDHDQDAA